MPHVGWQGACEKAKQCHDADTIARGMCVCVLPCCRYDQLLTLVHSVNGASLLVGGPGTAKTTVINQFLGKFNSEVSPAGFYQGTSCT
jgi:hypothetical protein